jgi:predicted transcriptional regulator
MRVGLGESHTHSDVILPMQDPYMDQIINRRKNYEFRKYRLKPSVTRIWFYRTAPHSSITHVCETLPAKTRNLGDAPLDEDGLVNAEFNRRDKGWEGYDFAYKIVTVYKLRQPISLKEMKYRHGFKSAPRGLVYLPLSISKWVDWRQQKLVRNLAFTFWHSKRSLT